MGNYILEGAAQTAPPAHLLDLVWWQQQWLHQKGPESQPPNCGPEADLDTMAGGQLGAITRPIP